MGNQYQVARARGDCPACWNHPAVVGKSYCERCLRNLAGQKRRHRRRRGEEYKAMRRAYMRRYRLARHATALHTRLATPPAS